MKEKINLKTFEILNNIKIDLYGNDTVDGYTCINKLFGVYTDSNTLELVRNDVINTLDDHMKKLKCIYNILYYDSEFNYFDFEKSHSNGLLENIITRCERVRNIFKLRETLGHNNNEFLDLISSDLVLEVVAGLTFIESNMKYLYNEFYSINRDRV